MIKNIENHRILFGPARGYTTSVWNFFKQFPDEFHTTDLKEFDNSPLTVKKYLFNYDQNKIYIDCSLIYYKLTQNNKILNDIKFSKNTFIYHIRNLKDSMRSLFLLSLTKKNPNLLNFSQLANYYDLTVLNEYQRFNVVMIQNFDIYLILNYLNIDIPKRNFLKYNSVFNKYQQKKLFIKNYKLFEELFNENITQFRFLVDNNVEIIKKHTILGDFNEKEYRRE